MCFSVNSTLFANVLTYPETPKLSFCPSQNTLPLSARKPHKDAPDGFRKLQTLKSLRAPAIAVSLPKDHLTGWTATWWCTWPCHSMHWTKSLGTTTFAAKTLTSATSIACLISCGRSWFTVFLPLCFTFGHAEVQDQKENKLVKIPVNHQKLLE